MDDNISRINYLIKFINLGCDDVSLHIQSLYFKLVKNNYLMSKLQQLMNDGIIYGFEIDDRVFNVLSQNEAFETKYIIETIFINKMLFDMCVISKSKYSALIMAKLSDTQYEFRIVIEGYYYQDYLNFTKITEPVFKHLVINLIDFIKIHSYEVSHSYHHWTKRDEVSLIKLVK